MMAALDGEIGPSERDELDRALAADEDLRREWERLGRVKEVTSEMRYRKPPDEVWDRYFERVYNRTERAIGWILLSGGVLVLAAWGVWHAVRALLADTDMPPLLKGAVFAAVCGALVLIVSVVRERLFVRKSDPYGKVQR